MRVYALDVARPAQAKAMAFAAPAAPPKQSRTRPPILSIAISVAGLAAILAAGAWYYLIGPRRALVAIAPAQLSIVVLPLTNLSGEGGQDEFADEITENLTTNLSRSIRGAFVIARDTAFTFKGKNASARVIGRQLGVQYVLEGSVQRTGNQVRVSVKLVDTETGDYLWADRFSDDLTGPLKLQDDIVSRLARALHIEHCVEIHRAPALAGLCVDTLPVPRPSKWDQRKLPDEVTVRGLMVRRPGDSSLSYLRR
jgi:TolB-like protein